MNDLKLEQINQKLIYQIENQERYLAKSKARQQISRTRRLNGEPIPKYSQSLNAAHAVVYALSTAILIGHLLFIII